MTLDTLITNDDSRDKFRTGRPKSFFVVVCQGYDTKQHKYVISNYELGLGFQYCPPCQEKKKEATKK